MKRLHRSPVAPTQGRPAAPASREPETIPKPRARATERTQSARHTDRNLKTTKFLTGRKKLGAGSAGHWLVSWRRSRWATLRKYRDERLTRSLSNRLGEVLLSWPLQPGGRSLPYTRAEVATWTACMQRELDQGDGQYEDREAQFVFVLAHALIPALKAMKRSARLSKLDEIAAVVRDATSQGITTRIVEICRILEWGRDAAWRDRQRAYIAQYLGQFAKDQARYDRWLAEGQWVLKHRDELNVPHSLAEALADETRPRSWRNVRLPLGPYRVRSKPGAAPRPWEAKVQRRLRTCGLSADDALTLRRSCGLMERARGQTPPMR